MRALVIDDSRAVRIIIGNILREMGMEVVEAGNGRRAGAAAREPRRRPRAGRLEHAGDERARFHPRRSRSARRTTRVRIVMVTTETESEQVMRALDAGANEYVMKPFTKDVLVAKLSMLDVFGE